MTPTTAQSAAKKLNSEIFSLTPSALITLFEIDIGDIVFQNALYSDRILSAGDPTVFRFHNTVKLFNSDVWWKGNQYAAAPIRAEGFETNGRGTLPKPKLSLTVSEEGIDALSKLKSALVEIGDLTGATVTRIRTFAKYLDSQNFQGQPTPDGFDPDPNVEFARDKFFIDRKSQESKLVLEFELSSILDVEGVLLPRRIVSADRCPFTYRGPGCLYEYLERTSREIHGPLDEMPVLAAPPVANDRDEVFGDLIRDPIGHVFSAYSPTAIYAAGRTVYIERQGLKFYFVSKQDGLIGVPPPNPAHWYADNCSKTPRGCALRFGAQGSVTFRRVSDLKLGTDPSAVTKGALRFGGFAGVNKFS